MSDVLRAMGPVFLGSRLKRLGERMQVGAARLISDAGLNVQPAHMPLLVALDGQPLTIGQVVNATGISQPGVTRGIGQLVDMGLVRAETGRDQRHRLISLTENGIAAMVCAKIHVWPQVNDAVDNLLSGRAKEFLAMLTEIEDILDSKPLNELTSRDQLDLE